MNSVCVFCGARPGHDPVYLAAARATGTALAQAGVEVIFGGGQRGMMGEVANAALAAGGRVTGVLPHFLADQEGAHPGVTEMVMVSSMHERKLEMARRAEGIVALPGGYGTLEELCEMLTWGQLGLHRYPMGLLDVAGYYQPLVTLFDQMEARGFLSSANRRLVLVDDTPDGLLSQMRAYRSPVPLSPAALTPRQT